MLILFESSVGYSLFRVLDEDKLKKTPVENICAEFDSASRSQFIQLHAFQPFADMDEAREAAQCLNNGEADKLHKSLSKFLKKHIIKKKLSAESLGVIDPKVGGLIRNKYGALSIVSDGSILELHRGLREHMSSLLSEVVDGLDAAKSGAMNLGLSHVLSRHKIAFSAEKVDTMIIQAIALLDELDKEVNVYAMRCKEWYGWHFPEMAKCVADNMLYCRCILAMGFRAKCSETDLSDILEEDTEVTLKNMAKISMGSDITDSDLSNITSLATQVLELSEYRNELYDYLRKRMMAIAPNLTLMVGELVGARLLSHAGSLVSLAKYPASTVQILGAEKALFRALKTKSDTPKYGLIYHASFVNAASQMNKAKVARTLACKTSLAARVDAFTQTQGDEATAVSAGTDMAAVLWSKMQKRIDHVEGQKTAIKSKSLAGSLFTKHEFMGEKEDSAMKEESKDFQIKGKRKREDGDEDGNGEPKKKKAKVESESGDESEDEEEKARKKAEKKRLKKEKKERKRLKKEKKASE